MTENLADMSYYAQALAVFWPVKVALAAIAGWFGTEPELIYWLAIAWVLDWVFGLWEAFKRGRWSCRAFKRGALKMPSYGLCMILVYGADVCIEKATHIDLPIFDLAVAYLAIQESISVFGHMMRLGLPVPRFLHRILLHGKRKVEKQVDDLLDVEESKKD